MDRRILVIDDDAKLCELLAEFLGGHGFRVESAQAPDKGLAALARGKPDAVILDVMLPGMDGFEVCRKIRESSSVPIIMLTARGDVMDRVVGLEIGADDYLPKPFEPRELAARLHALLRRGMHPAERRREETLEFEGLRIDRATRAAELVGGRGAARDAGLTVAEFDVLDLLVAARPAVVGRDELIGRLRGFEREVYDRSVDILVSRVRSKLGDPPSSPRFIKTFRGAGYAFIGRPQGKGG